MGSLRKRVKRLEHKVGELLTPVQLAPIIEERNDKYYLNGKVLTEAELDVYLSKSEYISPVLIVTLDEEKQTISTVKRKS